jgi:RND family efflux transporter MFP subunit
MIISNESRTQRNDMGLTALISFMVIALTAFTGCNQSPPAAAPPPVSVTVSKPEKRLIENWDEFTGRTAAVNLVNITSRVSGYIVEVPFKEGDLVHKGELLFQIDPRPYQHVYDQAVGQLQRAEANQKLQDATFERQDHLRVTGVIAKEDYDTAVSNKSSAAAEVIAAQAAVSAAKLNLEFTHVSSPIDGRVSRQLVNIGNLVQADSTRLTTVVSIDPIYAYFSMDELAALNYRQMAREGKLASGPDGKVLVDLQLQNEQQFPHQGTIDFSDNAYNTSTGTLLVRGTFANPGEALTPGNFVRVRVPSGPKYSALLIADRAIGSDQDQSFVYVVDGKDTVQLRHIKTGALIDGLRVVTLGLQPDDLVVVNGIINIRPGALIKAQPGSMEEFASNDSAVGGAGSSN